ncbi:MAG: amidohydrolase family protein [Bacteroidetes bacterium]|nr:amidohydrolase family protein [Bacteroidota bacterium]HET6244863.1 amidohydrolase family protein [Bacteroidia bacterium]
MAKRKDAVFPWLTKIAGNYNEELQYDDLKDRTKYYIKEAFKGIPEGDFRDYHCHILGLGTGKSGNYINPKMTSWILPFKHLKFNVFANAAGVKNIKKSDQQYVERLITLAYQIPGKFALLALDKFYRRDGSVNTSNTMAYVPNRLVYEISKQFPNHFFPCASIHPYRKNAINQLEKWAELGVKQIKWLPNSMGMDPSDKKCTEFYRKMVELDLVLLTHTGKEEAIPVWGFQHLGNPLLYRRPLDMGVKIIMAHCAGLGRNSDLDRKPSIREKNYKLFLRLMAEEQYKGNLFGDISAMTQINRLGAPLRAILKRTKIHHRLINGSDYPLPAVNSLIWTRALVKMGYLDKEDRKPLNEIYKYNPLLFDFVLKRNIHHPTTGDKFDTAVFRTNYLIEHVSAKVHYE